MFYLMNVCPADYVETHYEVAVDDAVSFTEFYNKYTILEERAETFLVKERLP